MQALADTMAERLGIQFPENPSPQASAMAQAMTGGQMPGGSSQENGREDSVAMTPGGLVIDAGALGEATREWEAFLGTARSGTGGSDYGNLSRDYQDLVRRYFEAVARESAKLEEDDR